MTKFTQLEINRFEVEELNQIEVEQVLKDLDILIDHAGDIKTSIKLFDLKEKLLRHMVYLHSPLLKT